MLHKLRRQRLRKQSWLPCRRWKYAHYILALTIAFVTSCITFSITFYINSDSFYELISYLTSSGSHDSDIELLDTNLIENYKSRDFLGKSQSITYDQRIKYKDFNYLKPETLTYKNRTYSNNIEILFRFPKQTPISALLLIFHSCHQSAYDWFHTIERQRIIGAAVDLGYACLVFQAIDKDNRCWSNDVDIYENKDVQMVFKGLEGFYKEYPELVSLPRFTFGSSSGGIFSSIFAINRVYEIQGQILFISIILPEILYNYIKTNNYPPTAWIHMLRDIEFASEERINISKQILTECKIPHKAFPIEPIRLRHPTFNERIPSVSRETSGYILYRLQQNEWINSHGFLMYNPRRKFAWQLFLFDSALPAGASEDLLINLNKNKNTISEFLNTIYGEHAISYERSSEALKWLQESSGSSKQITPSKI